MMLSHVSQSDREFNRQTAKAYYRQVSQRLTQPVMFVKLTGKHSIDLHDINSLPWMVGCSTYLVDMGATVPLSTGDIAVVNLRKFLKPFG